MGLNRVRMPVTFCCPVGVIHKKKLCIGSSDMIMLLQLHQQSQHSIIHLWNRKRIWWNDQQSRKTICLAHHLVGWRCSSCCCLAINLPQTPSRFFWSYLVDGASAAKWRFVFLVKASSKFYFLQNNFNVRKCYLPPRVNFGGHGGLRTFRHYLLTYCIDHRQHSLSLERK